MQRQTGQDFFYFSRKEKNGIVILCLINVVIILFPYCYEMLNPPENFLKVESLSFSVDSSSKKNDLDEYQKNQSKQSHSKNEFENKQIRLFSFDPNTIDAEQWQELGVYPKTIATIQKYLQKGGRFRKPEDLKKIWGFSEKKSNELIPYVNIPEQKKQADVNLFERKYSAPKIESIDINSCDSAMLEKLPGIGPKLSQRIISYRNKLGGFYDKVQLKDVFGLNDSVYLKIISRIIVDSKKVQKLDINLCDKNILKNHPYIRYKIADAIIQYRDQRGDFTTPEQLKNIILINDSILKKIQPYIGINPLKN